MNIILYQPEIPPNTGNIIRLCANTGTGLHLVEPLGFLLTDRKLRRAGLDYHDLAKVKLHRNFEDAIAALEPARLFAFTTKARRIYAGVRFRIDDALLFGPETRGLPEDVMAAIPCRHTLRIPMCSGNRSLNLSNAVAVVVYEAWRQHGFAGCA